MNHIKAFISFILVLGSSHINSQNIVDLKQGVDFELFIKCVKENIYLENPVELPLIYKGEDYNIAISDNPIPLNILELNLNPIENKYPISYSVIYKDKLISLFDKGLFICHTIPTMERDVNFEKYLNTKKIEYIWYIDNKLIGISKGKYYYFDSDNKWNKYLETIPVRNQPKLFEDECYICFNDCHGEWGGTVYFFDKKTKNIYFTEASCANSILKKDNKYLVLSHLGHMFGFSDLKEIPAPSKLSKVNSKDIGKKNNGEALGYADYSGGANKIFEYFGIQLFSSFVYQTRTLYITYWEGTTFLAEIKNNVIEIVNPLFNNPLYTDEPITNSYGNILLINLDFYGIAKEKEVSCLILQDNQLIKINWNK